MPSAPDPSEEQLAETALHSTGTLTAELLTMVEAGLQEIPARSSEDRFALLAMKADASQAKLRARRTGH